MEKLKTFENYDNTGEDDPTREELNAKIKVILNDIIKTKQYVKMLRDSTEHVFDMINKKYPKNINDFVEELSKRDDMLADMVESIHDQIDESLALDDLDEIIGYIEQIQEYTADDNMDLILNQNSSDFKEEDVEEEDDDEMDDDYLPKMTHGKNEIPDYPPNDNFEDDDEYVEIMKPKDKEDQLKRKQPKTSNIFKKGDKVKILSGELRDQIGVIDTVQQSNKLNKYKIKLNNGAFINMIDGDFELNNK